MELCSSCDHVPHKKGECSSGLSFTQALKPCHCIANMEVRPRTGLNDGPPGSILRSDKPDPVPDSIIGNILDHWEMLPGDTRQDLKDMETGFYNAMERLTDWIEENR